MELAPNLTGEAKGYGSSRLTRNCAPGEDDTERMEAV